MVFKRRRPKGWAETFSDMVYPRGGWRRAGTYVIHRVRRLPDAPHRIGRGVFAGVLISFTPLFGFHFLGAAAIAWVICGNILAALLATFIGNPVTMPLIAYGSVELGHFLLGSESVLTFQEIADAFGGATGEVWRNLRAAFTADIAHWENLGLFFRAIFVPYMTGGLILGTIAGVIGHYLTLPVVGAYKARRARKLQERMMKLRGAAAEAEAAAEAAGGGGAQGAAAPGVDERGEPG
ncbi:MAG: DUF2062 domain-containing protein [Rhodobacteraceae bacterium]|nr:DUF2062 domain-containing protein [Paracoccaceae bacterium]